MHSPQLTASDCEDREDGVGHPIYIVVRLLIYLLVTFVIIEVKPAHGTQISYP